MLTIGICDDMSMERSILCGVLEQLLKMRGEKFHAEEYSSGDVLLADLEEGYHYDLLFIDIYMGDSNGVEVARRIREKDEATPLVFLTSSPDYAVESYDVDAAGYLLKPLDTEKLQKLLDKVLSPAKVRYVQLHCGRQIRYVAPDDVQWVESRNHILVLHMSDGEQVETRLKLDEIEEIFDDVRFLRCHQSFLVNMDHVSNVKDGFCMEDGNEVPIRVRTKKQIVDTYHSYFASREGN